MKKFKFVLVALLLAGFTLGTIGCDNRSDLEKSVDKAASDTKGAAKDAQKKLDM